MSRTIIIISLSLGGLFLDGISSHYGLLDLHGNPSFLELPVWLWLLWFLLPLTFWHSLKYIIQKKYFCLIGFGVMGPLTYWSAGQAFSLISVDNLMIFFSVYGLFWALYGFIVHQLVKKTH